MEFNIRSRCGYEMEIKADNVHITEDIEERIYTKGGNGKIDFKIPPKRDIKTETIEQFSTTLNSLVDYRNSPIDSTNLIWALIDKMPEDKLSLFIDKICEDFSLKSID